MKLDWDLVRKAQLDLESIDIDSDEDPRISDSALAYTYQILADDGYIVLGEVFK